MSKENVYVELTAPSGKGAYTDVGQGRLVQVTLNDATVVIDGVTYTRTSPLRTTKVHAAMGISLPDVADGNASRTPVAASPAIGDVAVAIFSDGGA